MKTKHLQTEFIKFIMDKYSNEIKDENEIPEDDKDLESEDNLIDEEDLIDELLTEYKKLKKHYENNRIHYKKGRKTL